MRRTIIAAGVLMLLAWPAWAERHSFEGKSFDTENTTSEKLLHQSFGAGFQGDTHYDFTLDGDGGPSGTPSETGYAHGPYPLNGVPDYYALFVLETNETTVGKQACLEVIGCAQANGDSTFGCTDAGTHASLIFSLPVSGGAFGRTFLTVRSTTDTILHAGGGNTPCTLSLGADCANSAVRYKVRINKSLAGCTNPSADGIQWRIKWMHTYTTP